MAYNRTRAELIAYLHAKVREQDWHAVVEAAKELSTFDILEARSRAAAGPDHGRPSESSEA